MRFCLYTNACVYSNEQILHNFAVYTLQLITYSISNRNFVFMSQGENEMFNKSVRPEFFVAVTIIISLLYISIEIS